VSHYVCIVPLNNIRGFWKSDDKDMLTLTISDC